MRIYLVRHGEAERKEVRATRPLTAQGRRDVEKVAAFAASRIRDLEAIWHSDKARARETAEIMARHVAAKRGLVERKDLSPGANPRACAADMASSEGDVMIVGHLPFLQKLAGLALTNDEDLDVIRFDAGALVCLDQDESGDLEWRIAWIVSPGAL